MASEILQVINSGVSLLLIQEIKNLSLKLILLFEGEVIGHRDSFQKYNNLTKEERDARMKNGWSLYHYKGC